jgi:hypothetical protein
MDEPSSTDKAVAGIVAIGKIVQGAEVARPVALADPGGIRPSGSLKGEGDPLVRARVRCKHIGERRSVLIRSAAGPAKRGQEARRPERIETGPRQNLDAGLIGFELLSA